MSLTSFYIWRRKLEYPPAKNYLCFGGSQKKRSNRFRYTCPMNKIMRVFEILLSAPLLCPSRDLYIHGDISLVCSSHQVVAFSFESSGLSPSQSIRSNSLAGTRIHIEFLTPDPGLSLLTEQSSAYFTVHAKNLSEKVSS